MTPEGSSRQGTLIALRPVTIHLPFTGLQVSEDMGLQETRAWMTGKEVMIMQYRLTWLDSTLVRNYSSKSALRQEYAQLGIKLRITHHDNQWYEFECEKLFEANSDAEAKSYVDKYDFAGGSLNGTGVFTLRGIDSGLHWTEEDTA
jgi:hypothetical protein